MIRTTLGRALVALALAAFIVPAGTVAPASAAPPQPAFVELQGNTMHNDPGLQLWPVAYVKDSQNIKGMQVVFVVDFNAGTDPAPYVSPLWRSGYPRNPVADEPLVTIPDSATTVTITATFQHVSAKTGLVDHTYAILSGTGTIDRSLLLGEDKQIIYVTP